MALETFLEKNWPKPDFKLARFISDIQKGDVDHTLSRRRKLVIPAGKTHVLRFPHAGTYPIEINFADEIGIEYDLRMESGQAAIYKPILQVKRELIIRDTKIFYQVTYQPALFLTPLGAQASYEAALKLFEESQEAWNRTGMLERAQKIKQKRDTLPKDNLAFLIYFAGRIQKEN